MKLPRVLAQTDVPVGGGARYTSAAYAPQTAAVEGISAVGKSFTTALNTYAEAEEKKQQQTRITDSLNAYGRASSAMDEYEDSLETGKRDPLLGNMTEAPATHKDYVTRWEQGWKQTTGEILSGLTDPDTRRRTQNLLERERIQRYSRARQQQNKLFRDSEESELDELENVQATRAALDPDPEARKFAEQVYLDAVAAKEGVSISLKAAGNRRRGFTEKVAIAQAGEAIKSGTYNAADYAGRVDSIRLGALTEQDVREREHREQRTQVTWARNKEESFALYYAAGRDGQLTATEFKKDNEFFNFAPAQQKAVLDAIAGRDVDDDQTILKEIRLRSRKADLDQADVEWLAEQYAPTEGGDGKISAKSYEHWNGIFTATAGRNVAEGRRLTSEEKSRRMMEDSAERERKRDAKEREREALGNLSRALHVDSELDRLTGAGRNAFNLASERFTQRVRAGEDPDVVWRDEMTRHMPLLGDQATKYVDAVRRTLGNVRVPEELGTRAEAERRFGIKGDDYDRYVRKLREVVQIETTLADLNFRKPAPAVGKDKLGPASQSQRSSSAPPRPLGLGEQVPGAQIITPPPPRVAGPDEDTTGPMAERVRKRIEERR